MITSNYHQRVIDKVIRVCGNIRYPIKYSKYKNDNDLEFSDLDIGYF